MFTRIFRSSGSSVIGSGNEPRSTSVPAFSISPSAQGPWKYMAASPCAIAVLPSPYARLEASSLKYGISSSIRWTGASRVRWNETSESGPTSSPISLIPW